MIKIALAGLLINLFLIVPTPAEGQLRSFNDLFPGVTEGQKHRICTPEGMINSFLRNENPLFIPASGSGINLMPVIMEKIPAQLIEALFIIPYNGRPYSRLEIYNAFRRIRDFPKYTIETPRGPVPVFEESTRIEVPNWNRPIPDPPPALTVPDSEIVFVRVRDMLFGITYFRGEFNTTPYGITYRLINSAAIWYIIFPVMGSEKLAMALYAEPVQEGLLIYGLAGIDIPMFIAARVDIASNVNIRVKVIIDWFNHNLRTAN